MATVERPPRPRRPNVIWPIILIVAGVLLLLGNLGFLPASFWTTIGRLWPVILILLGLDIILSRQLGWGALPTSIVIIVIILAVIAYAIFAGVSGLEANLPLPGLAIGPPLSGSGNLVTQEKSFRDFNQVEVAGPFQVDITQSSAFSVTLTADDNVIDRVAVTKDGQTLRISLEPTTFLSSPTLVAKIGMPGIVGLRLSGAAKGNIAGFQSSSDLSLEMSGASTLGGQIDAGNAVFTASGASSGALQGSANSLTLNASGASRLDLGGFSANDVTANLSGASTATVNANGRLNVVLTGASRLTYLGNPTIGSTSVSGGSSLERR
ncbi:MAG: DUF2807 domain-containing protein [Chloroflexi bacterium]|nr:DUF2807 domain-containing protein [Chloroflexota bacterium]MCL5026425.1 DUF2807 domain-containing protein [Chloroflexota bacterium]